MNITFIGTGVMGASMAMHLLRAGHTLSVYNRTKEKAQKLIDEGALFKENVKVSVEDADVVITIVGFPKDVEEVYFGDGGIIENAPKGATLIDMTTTKPSLSVSIYQAAKARGLSSLDAPVSGGDVGAKNGTLSIMVGGDLAVYEQMLPVLSLMGNNIIYEGEAGAGQHTKMANQIAIAGTIAGVAEAVAYGKTMGLDMDKMLASIGAGAAGSWQMANLAPKMAEGDFAPGFFIKHLIKDLTIAEEEGKNKSLDLGVTSQVCGIYKKLNAEGMGEDGTQGIISYYWPEDTKR